jgi:hypothetical protein
MLYDNDTFEHKGREFTVTFPHEDCQETPWQWCDGHGVVSEQKYHPFGHGTKPPKAPGARILYWDRGYYRTYDVAETTRVAKRDGWGPGNEELAKLAQAVGRMPTRKEIVAAAVDQDFEYLRRWCNDEWSYVGVVVKFCDEDGDELECESLWGVESDDNAYLETVAHELADEICARLDDAMAQEIAASRPDMAPTY